jgi:hypothetical protein
VAEVDQQLSLRATVAAAVVLVCLALEETPLATPEAQRV